MVHRSILALIVLAAGCAVSGAQDLGTVNPKPLPPLENPNDPKTPAKELFGRKTSALAGTPRAIGYYTGGCLAGGAALPINGPNWQVMRLSRNRNWGHPNLIRFLERFAAKMPSIGWNGLLVGDMAQPRGGPMLNGHWSHQVGLDADIWLLPMPNRELTQQEREETMSTNLVNDEWTDVRPELWSQKYIAFYKLAATDPEVERVLVNPAIKKALCRDVVGDRSWLHKVRPVIGHNYHTHIRIGCPPDSPQCKSQPAPPHDEGCGVDLAWWFKPKPRDLMVRPGGASRAILMAALPAACRYVVQAPDAQQQHSEQAKQPQQLPH